MSLDAKKISILKHDVPSGLHNLTITDVRMHKKSNGEIITYQGNPGIVLSFSKDGLIHQELYWINGYNYTKLQKLLVLIGLDPTNEIHKKEIIGRGFWGVIIEVKVMRGSEFIKSEKKLTNTYPYSELAPNYSGDFIEFKEDSFNQDTTF